MKIGLVGFPGSGKSTVFNALTGMSVETGYGSKGGKANLGVVKVPDARVDKLAEIYQPKKTTYAEVAFTDLGGGTTANSLDRSVLNNMREVDVFCQVVQAFPAPDGTPADPLGQILGLEAETILADIELIERRVDRLTRDRSSPRELELLTRLLAHCEDEKPLRSAEMDEAELKLVSGYRFLSQKKLLLVLNVPEDEVGNDVPADISSAAEERGLGLVVLSAQVEMDIAQMPAEDQAEFLESLGLSEPAKNRFIEGAYALIDLISMLTAGPDECRAWPVQRNTAAPRAAGKIHSDIERGFIRAEVIGFDDLVEHGSEAKVKEAGKTRVEGKDYIVKDGDIVNFRFNV